MEYTMPTSTKLHCSAMFLASSMDRSVTDWVKKTDRPSNKFSPCYLGTTFGCGMAVATKVAVNVFVAQVPREKLLTSLCMQLEIKVH